MKNTAKKRIFLVGCPRSGTTLLQSLLAAHPEIISFPESKFFLFMVPTRPRLSFGLASPRLKSRLEKFFKQEIDHPEMLRYFSPFTLFMSQYTQTFINTLDLMAEEQGKQIWLEKTPQHIKYIYYIEKFVADAKIIHIVRDGADVIASLYEATRIDPHSWAGQEWSINRCINEWLKSVEITRINLHKPNHIIVRYDKLVENTSKVLSLLCEFIGIQFDDVMLQDYGRVSQQVSLKKETWKSSVARKIVRSNSYKFDRVFNKLQKQYILNRIAKINLDDLSG